MPWSNMTLEDRPIEAQRLAAIAKEFEFRGVKFVLLKAICKHPDKKFWIIARVGAFS
jgi:hypothetical protein